MRVSRDEALQMLHKWKSENDSCELFVVLEELRSPEEPDGAIPPLRFLCRFRGRLIELSDETESFAVKGKDGAELVVSFSEAKLEYEDSREAPEKDRERAAASLSGWVIITSDHWRCTLFEPL